MPERVWGHKRRKGEICFWKIFCRNRASKTVFFPFAYIRLKIAKCDKKIVCFTKNSQSEYSNRQNNGAVRTLRLLQPHYNWIIFTARLFSLHSSVLFRAECTNKDRQKRRMIKRGNKSPFHFLFSFIPRRSRNFSSGYNCTSIHIVYATNKCLFDFWMYFCHCFLFMPRFFIHFW